MLAHAIEQRCRMSLLFHESCSFPLHSQLTLHSPVCGTAAACPALQHWLTDAELDRLMRFYDMDGSGDLDEPEFQRLVSH